MLNDLTKILAYAVAFTSFNLLAFLVYFITGNVIFKKTANKIKHSPLPVEQIEYLEKKNFKNVQHEFVTDFGRRIRNFSVFYIIFSEIVCFIAMLLSEKYVLICRIALFTDAFLVLLMIILLIFFKIKSKKLANEHQENLQKALATYKK